MTLYVLKMKLLISINVQWNAFFNSHYFIKEYARKKKIVKFQILLIHIVESMERLTKINLIYYAILFLYFI